MSLSFIYYLNYHSKYYYEPDILAIEQAIAIQKEIRIAKLKEEKAQLLQEQEKARSQNQPQIHPCQPLSTQPSSDRENIDIEMESSTNPQAQQEPQPPYQQEHPPQVQQDPPPFHQVQQLTSISHRNDPKENPLTEQERRAFIMQQKSLEAEKRKEKNNEIADRIKKKNNVSQIPINIRIQKVDHQIEYEQTKLQEIQTKIAHGQQTIKRKADLAVQWYNTPCHFLDIAIVMSQGESMETTLTKKYNEKHKIYEKYKTVYKDIEIIPLIFSSQGMIYEATEGYLKGLLQQTGKEQWKRIWNNYKLQIMATNIRYTTANVIRWINSQEHYERYHNLETLDISPESRRLVHPDQNVQASINMININNKQN